MAVDLKRSAERGTCSPVSGPQQDMHIVIVGHVDHGKSTIIGRLLADTNSLPKGKMEQVIAACKKEGRPFEYAYFLDALKDEQAQGITIDAARCFFKSAKRNYIIIDAPGHIEFLKNMVTGAARAQAALLVIDATEGIRENSRRHGYMLRMLGIKQVAVLVNKMDLAGYEQDAFETIAAEYARFLASVGLEATHFLPVSGVQGDHIAGRSTAMPWYEGPTVLEVLDGFEVEAPPVDQPLRLPVQGVYRFTQGGDRRRIVAGTIEAGRLRVGDAIVFYPSGKASSVRTIEAFNQASPEVVEAGRATGFTLGEQIYVTRGEVATLASEPAPQVATRLRANLFWLGREPMRRGRTYLFKLGTAKVEARLEAIERVLDASDLKATPGADEVQRNEVAECVLRLVRPVAFDTGDGGLPTARFVIVDKYEISGGGIVQEALPDAPSVVETKATDIVWQPGKVTHRDRCEVLGQQGGVVWFTGLSGAGKSTIASEVERRLNEAGRAVYLLDGDNVRHGLNADLGFSPTDRDENIRRIAEVAALFQDAGLITLVSLIAPYRRMREFARSRVGPDRFLEVYVKADLETCIERDPKGLYQKALRGEISDFTGVSSPYEEPTQPDLELDTTELSVGECVERVLERVRDWYGV